MLFRAIPFVLLLGCASALSACAQEDLVALRIEALDGGDVGDAGGRNDPTSGTGQGGPTPATIDGSDCSASSRSLYSVIRKIDPETCSINIADIPVTDVVLTIFLASLTPPPVSQEGIPIPLICMGPQIWYADRSQYFVCPAHCEAALTWLEIYQIQSRKCPGAGMP